MTIPLWDDVCCWGDISYDDDDDEYTPKNKHEGKTWNQSCMAKDGDKNE